jgi:hypothetical protein
MKKWWRPMKLDAGLNICRLLIHLSPMDSHLSSVKTFKSHSSSGFLSIHTGSFNSVNCHYLFGAHGLVFLSSRNCVFAWMAF